MTTRNACLLVAALLAAGPPAPAADVPAELRGAWRLVSVTAEVETTDLPGSRPELVFKGERVLYGGEEIARLAADPATQPKVIDLHFRDPKRDYEGVYVVEKDRLKVCLHGRSEGVRERPNGFDTTDHPAWRLLTFEWIKEDEVGPGSAYMGVALRIDRDNNEVVVQDTIDGSPAKKAGLRKDDVLVEVDGVKVTDLQAAVAAVRRARPRTELPLRIRRDGKESEVKVKVGLLPFGILAGLE